MLLANDVMFLTKQPAVGKHFYKSQKARKVSSQTDLLFGYTHGNGHPT